MKNHGKLEFIQFMVSVNMAIFQINHQTYKQTNRNYHYSKITQIDSGKITNKLQQTATGTTAALASKAADAAAMADVDCKQPS